MKAAKPILLSFLLSALLVACGDDSSTGSGGGSSEELSSGTSFVPGLSDEGDSSEEETSGSSSSRGGKSSAKVTSSSSSSSSSSSDDGGFCGAETYDPATQLCDHRDSAIYEIVRIGKQTWMKQNLNFNYKVNGSTYGNYCYNDVADSCARSRLRGRLYKWSAAMDTATTGCGYGQTCTVSGVVQGVCPNGWHLPDTAEWNALFRVVAEDLDTAGTALKTENGWYAGSTSFVRGTNSSGFSALPFGYRNHHGDYRENWEYAVFLSSSEDGADNAYTLWLYYFSAHANLSTYAKNYGFSVRCVKD